MPVPASGRGRLQLSSASGCAWQRTALPVVVGGLALLLLLLLLLLL